MDEKMVSFICHEADMTRLERANKRLFVVVIILIVALLGSNGAWLWYESQFEVTQETKVEQDVETGDGDTFVNGVGDINYGTDKTESYSD